jgi:hemerythrin-like domain-containing protein
MEDYILYSVDDNDELNKENNYFKKYNINNIIYDEPTIYNLKTELMYLKNIICTLNDKIDSYKKENSELKTNIDDLNNKYIELNKHLKLS